MTDWIPGGPTVDIRLLIGMAGARCILGLVSAFWWMRLGPRTSSNPLMDRTMSWIDFCQGAWSVPEQLFVYLWVEPDPGPCDGQGQDPVRLRVSEGHLPLSWLSLCPCRAACLAWGVPGLGLSGYWAHLRLGANKLEGFQNGISSTSELMVERATLFLETHLLATATDTFLGRNFKPSGQLKLSLSCLLSILSQVWITSSN